jgi:hypothetical protein
VDVAPLKTYLDEYTGIHKYYIATYKYIQMIKVIPTLFYSFNFAKIKRLCDRGSILF